MSDEIVVKVNSYGPGRPLSLVYFDPVSGRKKAKSSSTTDWREAERLAGELEKELRAGRYAPASKVTWADFRKRYEAEKSICPISQDRAQFQVRRESSGKSLEPRPALQTDGGRLVAFPSEATRGGHGRNHYFDYPSPPASVLFMGRIRGVVARGPQDGHSTGRRGKGKGGQW